MGRMLEWQGETTDCDADTFLTLHEEVGGDDNPVRNGGQISNSQIMRVKPRYIATGLRQKQLGRVNA